MAMTTLDFIALPGFFEIRKGSRSAGWSKNMSQLSEVWWQAGCDPTEGTGREDSTVRWGHGETLEAALADWLTRHGGRL